MADPEPHGPRRRTAAAKVVDPNNDASPALRVHEKARNQHRQEQAFTDVPDVRSRLDQNGEEAKDATTASGTSRSVGPDLPVVPCTSTRTVIELEGEESEIEEVDPVSHGKSECLCNMTTGKLLIYLLLRT